MGSFEAIRRGRIIEGALRRPRITVAAGLAIVAVLGVVGLGVEERLQPTSLEIAGSPSARGEALQEQTFGNSVPMAILLEGPPAALDRQGPRVVQALRDEGGVRTLSPWDRGPKLDRLRPDRDAALIVADFDRTDAQAPALVDRVEQVVAAEVSAPVESHLSGYAVIGKGLEEASLEATRRAELIAVPILIVVLLLVFRSPLAAAIPLAIGGATVLAARGLIDLAASEVQVDALAVSTGSMMGLALGVDYALLLVSRFREELDTAPDAGAAVRTTAATAGRTIVFAGSTLAAAMAVAAAIAPGSLLSSVAAAVLLVTLVSVAIATLIGPAVLLLAGGTLNRWMIGGRRGGRMRGPIRRALREPVLATILVLGLLLALAGPAVALETGPPNVEQLPPGSEARQDFKAIEAAAGPGWTAPFVAVATAGDGPVTDPKRLRALRDWQKQVAREDTVRAVVGPGQVARRLRPLRRTSERMDRGERRLERGQRALRRLNDGLDQASAGLDQLRQGLLAASGGAGQLDAGAALAAAGAHDLAEGLERAAVGAWRAHGALRAFERGAHRLAEGAADTAAGAGELEAGIADARRRVAERALPGARRLAEGLREGSDELERLREPAQIAAAELRRAFDELEAMSVGKADPRYPAALRAVGRAHGAVTGENPVTGAPIEPGYEGIDAELAGAVERLRRAARGASRLADGAERLVRGLGRLESGAAELADGAERVSEGAGRLAGGAAQLHGGIGRLADGLERLAGGAERLAGGVARLRGGTARLEQELAGGYRRSEPLQAGLERASDRLPGFRAELRSFDRGLERLDRRSPRLFDSGYFFLAALDGAPRPQRRRAGQAVNLEQGGGAARSLIIPSAAPNTPAANDLRDRLEQSTDELARELGGAGAITGGAAQIADYDRITESRLPLLVLALSLITYLILIPILRALLLPLIAVLLNLLTVAAAFGVLTFIYQVLPGAPLGGPGYIEAVSAAGIFGIVFGLSIDYEVFLLTRMREEYVASGGNNDRAIVFGLDRTAKVITGAAAIMAGVFLAFATAEISTIRQFGIGLTVAVILDATVVRLVLLPALMRLFGNATWWLPGWLDRALPRLDVEAPQRGDAAA